MHVDEEENKKKKMQHIISSDQPNACQIPLKTYTNATGGEKET